MQYRTLGRTGLSVSSLVLGAMNFGPIGRTSAEESAAIVSAALDAGVNLVDTADVYGNGESEEIVGKAIAGRRDDGRRLLGAGAADRPEVHRAEGERTDVEAGLAQGAVLHGDLLAE